MGEKVRKQREQLWKIEDKLDEQIQIELEKGSSITAFPLINLKNYIVELKREFSWN